MANDDERSNALFKVTSPTIKQNLLLFGLVFTAAMLTLSGLGVLTPIMGAIGHNSRTGTNSDGQ